LPLTFVAFGCSGAPEDALPADPELEAATSCTVTVQPARELLINALNVVEDPVRTNWTGSLSNPSDGAWTFGRLMTNMAGAQDPSTFVENWLNIWSTTQVVNSFAANARPGLKAQVTDRWPRINGKLDLTKAPFRLLAIVNRMDLRNQAAGNAGEGRFVFGVLDASGNTFPFTVILEYKLPATTADEFNAWANRWHALNGLSGSKFLTQLQSVTDAFAGPGIASTRPNGSSIGQIRTNEIAFGPFWELRQFELSGTGQLVPLSQVGVTNTPDTDRINRTQAVTDFVNQNESAILAGTVVVPTTFDGAPFSGNASANRQDFWNGAVVSVNIDGGVGGTGIHNNEARHQFSLNTCNGCHGGETRTSGFLHIAPRVLGQTAVLSQFLSNPNNIGTPDPVDPNTVRVFDDLARRRTDFRRVLCNPPTALADPPLNRVH
jgi:hypothetical protein